MKKHLPYQVEATLASQTTFLPRLPKNRRPSAQMIIEAYLKEETINPGHEHWSMTGMTAGVIATHLRVNGHYFVLRSDPMGYFIRKVV